MNRNEQISFCRTCKNKEFSPSQGIVCQLTDLSEDYNGYCTHYQEDAYLIAKRAEDEKQSYVYNNIAGNWVRFANLVLDSIFLYIIQLIFGFFVGLTLAFSAPSLISTISEHEMLFSYSFAFILGMLYFTIFEGFTGRTPAKYLTQTKVVTADGSEPSFGTIFVRSLCRFIPFDAVSFVFAGVGCGWHDRLSETAVIKDKA